MKDRYMIITCGPTGSGKTGLIYETLNHLGIDESIVKDDKRYMKILVDDLIENDHGYKEKIKDIIHEIDNECSRACLDDKCIDKCEKKIFEHPTEELFSKFEKAYFYARRHGCGIGCDEVNDDILRKIKKNKKLEVVIFETTGTYIPKWLLTTEYIPKSYKIIYSYSLVNLKNLMKRNKTRAFKSIQEFKKDNTQPAPRLPNVSKERFTKNIGLIQSVLVELYHKCIVDRHIDQCGNHKIDRLLIFDNNIKHKLIFDSTIDDLESIIDKLSVKKKTRKTRK